VSNHTKSHKLFKKSFDFLCPKFAFERCSFPADLSVVSRALRRNDGYSGIQSSWCSSCQSMHCRENLAANHTFVTRMCCDGQTSNNSKCKSYPLTLNDCNLALMANLRKWPLKN